MILITRVYVAFCGFAMDSVCVKNDAALRLSRILDHINSPVFYDENKLFHLGSLQSLTFYRHGRRYSALFG